MQYVIDLIIHAMREPHKGHEALDSRPDCVRCCAEAARDEIYDSALDLRRNLEIRRA